MKSERIVRAGIRFRNALRSTLFAIVITAISLLIVSEKGYKYLDYLNDIYVLCGILAVYGFIQFYMGANDLIEVNETIEAATARKENDAHLETSQDVNKMAPEEAVSKTTFVPSQDNSGPLESRAIEEIGDIKVRCMRCKVSVFVGPYTQNFICHNCKTKQKVG